jgi:hypothetical protein
VLGAFFPIYSSFDELSRKIFTFPGLTPPNPKTTVAGKILLAIESIKFVDYDRDKLRIKISYSILSG